MGGSSRARVAARERLSLRRNLLLLRTRRRVKLAHQLLPILLVAGGAYLCFEGGEKVLEKLGWLPSHHGDHDDEDTGLHAE